MSQRRVMYSGETIAVGKLWALERELFESSWTDRRRKAWNDQQTESRIKDRWAEGQTER